MKLIRNCVAETNSSSTHSISIADADGLYDTLPVNEDGNVVLTGGDFGWEVENYYDAETKANYMAVYAQQYSGVMKDGFVETLVNVIKEQTQCNDVIFEGKIETLWNSTETYLDNGYIDHQSVEENDYHYVFESPELLREFIFNKHSFLHTDNDNYMDYDDDPYYLI